MTKPEHIIKGEYDILEICNLARVPGIRFGGSRDKEKYVYNLFNQFSKYIEI